MTFSLEAYLQDLQYLVNFDNGSYTPEGTTKVAAFFQERFAKEGWNTEIINLGTDKVGPCLKVTNCATDDYDVLLLGHMDTVFPAGEAAKRPYKIDDKGIVTGVGVSDMKGCLLSAYYALSELKQAGKLNSGKVCFLLTPDEEISAAYSHDTILKVAAHAKKVLVVEAARKNGDMVRERSGTARIDLAATGVAAHAGVAPQDGSSAINELAHWIIELHKLSNYALGTSVNVGVISGGKAINIVADQAEAHADVRYKKPEELQRVQDAVKALAQKAFTPGGAKMDYTFTVTKPPMNASAETDKLCAKISEFGKAMGLSFNWVATGGASDGNNTAHMGIPTLDGIGPVGAGGHSISEWLDSKSVEPRLKLLERTIEYCITGK